MATLSTADIQKAYVTFFSRPADPVGLAYWQNYSGSIADLYATFAQQTEYSAAFSGLTSAQKVNVVYQNLFGRDAENAGLVYWAGQVEAGKITVANLALAVSAGSQGTDKVTVDSRVSAATSFTTAIDTAAETLGYTGATANAAAKTWLAGVTTAANLATAVAAIDTAVAGVVAVGGAAGSTFTLTTGVDTFTGTSGNDTFVADNVAAAKTSAADTINGGTGNDTLAIYSSGAASDVVPTLTSVETVSVYDEGDTLDVSGQTGVTAVNSIRGDGTAIIKVASGTAVNFQNVKLSSTNGAADVKADFGATATAATLGVNGVTAGGTAADDDVTVVGAALTDVTVNVTGTKSVIQTIDVAGAKNVTINASADLSVPGSVATSAASAGKLTVTGAGKVALGTIDVGFDTVDASANTGGVTLTDAGDTDTVYTLSKGNDTFKTAADGFATADKFAVNAGEGSDTLEVAADADVDTAAEAARYTGFEVIKRAINADLDVSNLTSITSASLGDGGLTKMSATLAGAIALTADNAGSTFSLATASGTSDVLSVTSANATATASADLTTVTIDGFETLNFAANTGDAVTTTTADRTSVSFTSAADLKTVTLTGTKSVNLDASANAAKITSISAAGVVGGAIIATGGQTGALVVTGSDVVDSITLGAVGTDGTVSVNAGAGNDTITTTQAIAAAAVSINGGAGTADELVLSDTATTTNTLTISDTDFVNVTGVEKIKLSAAVHGDTIWTLGGYANALATANGGLLTITATALATTATGDVITIDAGSMSTGNAINLNVKDTPTADVANSATLTGSSGNDTIKFENALAASDEVITINGGAGNDTITVVTTDSQDGAIVVNGGDGDDTIDLTGATSDAAVTSNLVTPGKGNDTIKLDSEGAATVITVVLGSSAANNGVDAISNFTQGANKDVIKPDAFLDATAMNAVITANPGASTAVESDVNLLVDIAGGQDITTAAGLTAALAAGGEYSNVDMAGNGKAVFVTAASNAAGQTQYVFYATADAAGVVTATLVGTIASCDIDSFDATNFNI